MTIRNQDTYLRSQVDWAIFDGIFPRSIQPSDLDGFVELNGHFLYLEHKLPPATLNEGQRRAFRRWAQQGHRVVTFWSEGDHQAIKRIRVDDIHGEPDPRATHDATLDTLRDVVAEWVEWAEVAPPPMLVLADRIDRAAAPLRQHLTPGQLLSFAASLIGGTGLAPRRRTSRRTPGKGQASLWTAEEP